ncbi:DUF1003 domain-containing protein [Sinomonas atrocyanea]|uniref:DUF1003 domain-containing protein n=1 Tax=Sinomonas atrocyanea TaxID=37927 RepID=UPI002855736F|nr:DUF1003 domain-containing protein [Sinomonas atrocyanea]MDR6620747.1 putative membrane protein [Sinomonas atrocyanea]
MAEPRKLPGLDTPLEQRSRLFPRLSPDPDAFGRFAENFARYMGTPRFLLYMTLFCVVWLGWNTFGPEQWQFDPRSLNYTLLTLLLSLQASYAAPLILLAQNRQDDRDRVQIEQDRSRNERSLADTEYLTRELASLRLALREVATRDFVRSELRSLLEDLSTEQDDPDPEERAEASKPRRDRRQRGLRTQQIPRVRESGVAE